MQIVSQIVTKACRIPPLQMQTPVTMQTTRVFVSLKIRIYRHFMNDRKNYHSTTIQKLLALAFDKNLAQESGLSLGTTITTHYIEFEGIGRVESILDSNQSVLVEFIPDLFSMPSIAKVTLVNRLTAVKRLGPSCSKNLHRWVALNKNINSEF